MYVRHLLPAVFALLAGCSASVNGTGGQGGTGGGGAGGSGGEATGGGGSGGSMGGPCTNAQACAGLSDECNVGACINGVCDKIPANDGASCDDGKACSQSDTCQNGACVGGNLKFCPSSDSCHIAYCDTETDACKEVPGNDGGTCDDADPCTLPGTCTAGACQIGGSIDCTFLDDECSTGQCDAQLGCVAIAKNDGAPCDDGLFCTVNDACSQGSCGGDPNDCGGNGGGCLVPSCDEGQNKCIIVPGNDGGPCDDGSNCTTGETCSAGQCVGGSPTNDGAPCDDGDGCTSGTTCAGGTCTNATMTIAACGPDDSCCPAGCVNDPNCLWWVSGVQQNVQKSQLVGWSQCYEDGYDNSNTQMSQILQQCSKGKLLLACAQQGSGTLNVLAMADRDDVLFDCGTDSLCTHQANGVGWYWSDQWSWGFAPGNQPVQRNSCDVQDQQNNDRICWHSGGGMINGGYRCGNASGLWDPNWRRFVYQAD